jgi:hypothetical protein
MSIEELSARINYIGILPECFELSHEAARYTVPSHLPQFHAMEGIYGCVRHLAGLGSKYSMIIHGTENNYKKIYMEGWQSAQSAKQYTSFTHFWQQREVLQVLRSIGLELYNGSSSLGQTLQRMSFESNSALPMSYVLVTDPEKARQYLNIGVHIGTNIPHYPSTLAEAADAYSKIVMLVKSTATPADIEKTIVANTDKLELWRLKREKFCLQMKEQYRQILLDTAREEWLDEQVSISNSSTERLLTCIAHRPAREEASKNGCRVTLERDAVRTTG